ncbi:hypothetical protein [Aliivibrio logei]|uniref:hypothetical protein n=1 Tax=Aliivibrio logei TaxID=688 RepID=UPI0003C79F25|nr:hypothetical protein [Aliivibrio logei]
MTDKIIWMIDVINILMLTIGMFITIFLTIYLVVKNKKLKKELIKKVADCAPPVFRERAINSMRNVAHNWLIGTMFPLIWFMYPILRFLCSLSNVEIITWRKNIRMTLGSIYSLCVFSLNLSLVGGIYLVARYLLSSS